MYIYYPGVVKLNIKYKKKPHKVLKSEIQQPSQHRVWTIGTRYHQSELGS